MSFIPFCTDLQLNKERTLKAIERSKDSVANLINAQEKRYNQHIKPYLEDLEQIEIPFGMIGHLNTVNNSDETQSGI